ncbi:fumarylacetoacetase [Ferruginibacter sp. SUN002]|uniref:fumarylacetoacetase n=1 Tax=Ferruginibacter sp. SUN002 TaxID=2937789 RepID=UPI003D360C1B
MNLEQSIKEHQHFTIHNLPYGVYATHLKSKRIGVAVGDYILDMAVLFDWGIFQPEIKENIFAKEQLNDFIALGKNVWTETRNKIQDLVKNKLAFINEYEALLIDKQSEATMYVPVHIGDYTDFYSSEEHASNVGKMFRPNMEPLLPNWKHMPIAYHGRSSSIITTNTPVKRPYGQILKGEEVIYSASQTLDIEIELGFIIGKENKLGEPIKIINATDYVFGCVLLNDFSARDIQRWEYQPLGPFLGKNFATSISPWIITYDALKEFLTEAPQQTVEVLPYLEEINRKNFDVEIHFDINKEKVAVTNSKYLYWTIEQQIAHHTVNGCNLRIGDLLGTGTISGKQKKSFGSLLEITWNGKEKIRINNKERTFLENGDTATLKAFCKKGDKQIGFGELSNLITA